MPSARLLNLLLLWPAFGAFPVAMKAGWLAPAAFDLAVVGQALEPEDPQAAGHGHASAENADEPVTPGHIFSFSIVQAHTRAMTQPSRVQPRKKFSTKMAVKFAFFRPTMAGIK